MLGRWFLRIGVLRGVLVITSLGVLASILLFLALGPLIDADMSQGILLSTVIPAVVAPSCAWIAMRILSQLDRTRRQLLHSEERFRSILEEMADGYFEVEEGGQFRYLNPAMCEILGEAHDAVIGGHAGTWLEGFSVAELRAAPPSHTVNVKPVEWTVRRQDGSERVVEAVLSLVEGVQRTPDGLRGVARDVTEQRRAQQERATLQDKLLQVQKMEALGTLAGGIAHDFNNILMGISGNVSYLRAASPKAQVQGDPLADIQSLVQSGAGLTRQLLGYARKGRYAVQTHDLNDAVRSAAKAFGRTRKEIEILLELEQTPLPIEVDLGQLDQVLLNLFVNAADAMPEGGTLTLRTASEEAGSLDSPVERSAKPSVRLEVSDNGSGIPPEVQQRIFEPFFTTKQMGQGTGLGLASVYGIVEGHGGHIDVRSTVGLGTTFVIHLPRASAPLSEPVAPWDADPEKRRTILLVDDEAMILRASARMLRSLGYQVLQATSGPAGVALYQRHLEDIDLVILDMIMPGMNGLQTFEQLKALDPDVRVVLTSGYSRNEQAEEILALGCAGFVQKPYSRDEIVGRIGEVLSTAETGVSHQPGG